MRNQAFLLAACAAVVIGCGGGGGGKKSVSTTSGSTTGGMNVLLDTSFGRVEVDYLTGEGRAAGDTYLEITRQTISDGSLIYNRDSLSPLDLNLAGFQLETARINVPFAVTTGGISSSVNFTEFLFDPNRILTETSTGSLSDTGISPGSLSDVNGTANILPYNLDARIRVFPGRTTAVQLFVSNASFPSSSGSLQFDSSTFKALNYSTSGTDPDAINHLASRLGDFVRFPLANVDAASRPVVRDQDGNPVTTASYVYFTGDNFALSDDAGAYFQEVGNVFSEIVLGKWAAGTTAGFQGTYDLRSALPTDVTGNTKIVSLYGSFRDYNKVLSGFSTFNMLMFPNSSEQYTFESNGTSGVVGRLGDLVAFAKDSSGNITNMYFGDVDLGKGTFDLYPILYLGADPGDDAAQAARVTGTVTSYLDTNGAVTVDYKAVRKFTYVFPTPPSGVPATGTVTVFRK